MLSPDDLAIVIEYIAASDAMHTTYGSTATCWGGVGGSALTPHCSHVCQNPVHKAAYERWDAAYRAVRQLTEREKSDAHMMSEEIANKVMTEHGMVSLEEFGKRMTLGELKRMLKHAVSLAREAATDVQ